MGIMIGSARADENYKYSGGRRGDQRQKSSYDTTGEVSLQPFYIHRKGWYVLRPIKKSHAKAIAKSMGDACNNKHIGYSQSDRLAIFNHKNVKNGDIRVDTNCDCSSLVRKAIIDGTGVDVGNFSTADEANVLEKSGLFGKRMRYTNCMTLYNGDVLVTVTKGHTAIVVSGNERKSSSSASGSSSKPLYTIGKKYTVKVNGLKMRKGPGTEYGEITTLESGDKLTCKQVKVVGGSTWIRNASGWVCALSSGGKVYVG